MREQVLGVYDMHTHTHTHTQCHIHTHCHTHTQSLSVTRTLSHTHSVHTHTHRHTSVTNTHTHTHIHVTYAYTYEGCILHTSLAAGTGCAEEVGGASVWEWAAVFLASSGTWAPSTLSTALPPWGEGGREGGGGRREGGRGSH